LLSSVKPVVSSSLLPPSLSSPSLGARMAPARPPQPSPSPGTRVAPAHGRPGRALPSVLDSPRFDAVPPARCPGAASALSAVPPCAASALGAVRPLLCLSPRRVALARGLGAARFRACSPSACRRVFKSRSSSMWCCVLRRVTIFLFPFGSCVVSHASQYDNPFFNSVRLVRCVTRIATRRSL
jgi:hypothetical protein